MANESEAQRILVTRLESLAPLSEGERAALLALPVTVRSLARGGHAAKEGEKPNASSLVVEGLLCRYKLLGDGRRQILSFHIPGDIPDLQSLFLPVMDHSLMALAPSKIAYIDHKAILEISTRNLGLHAAFWRQSLVDASMFREWIVNLGRRTAEQRVAHLFCEMGMRLSAVGLLPETSYGLPITQSELADATGLSLVHVNRVLQDMRQKGLISFQRSVVTIPNWTRLRALAEFDPAYLHLSAGAAPVA